MSKINLITAGAGTGKTTRLTDIIHDAMASDACRPGGLIATTYTVKAAQEITDRIRTRLFEAGLHCAAQRLHESMIGTVHSVCGRLLERFAFEAGISPQLQILPEGDADLLFARALEEACSPEEIELAQDLADRFEDRNRDYSYRWRQTVADIAEQLRANDLPPEALTQLAE
jgi:ATP-dependent helicase/nuclease subunit A